MRVWVLHEYGAWRHYSPLIELQRQRELELELRVINLPRRAIGAIARRDWKVLSEMKVDVRAVLELLASEGETVIVGVAPFHTDVLLLEQIKRQHRVILFTSWPHWSQREAVHHPDNQWLANRWASFMKGLEVACVTSAVADAVTSWGADACLMPHSVELDLARRDEPPTRASRFLFVGRLVPEKGIGVILEAVEALHSLAEFDVQFVGDGPCSNEVVRASESLPVFWTGYSKGSALWEAYAGADVLLLPSFRTPRWEELFGLTIIEGFASYLPAIVTDCVGPAEIVDDGQTGFVINQRSAAALADAMRKLIETPDLVSRLGARARLVAETRYSLSSIAERWRKLLHTHASELPCLDL